MPVVLLYLLQDFAIIIKAYYEPLPLLLVSCLAVVCVYACLCVWGWCVMPYCMCVGGVWCLAVCEGGV